MAELHQFFVNVVRGHGSVFLRRHYDTLCTSGFTDDVMFSYHRANGRIKHDVMFGRVRQVAVPVGHQTTAVFG